MTGTSRRREAGSAQEGSHRSRRHGGDRSACGVRFCRTANPDLLPEFVALLKEALVHARKRGVAVVIARQPCAMVARGIGRSGCDRITAECTDAATA